MTSPARAAISDARVASDLQIEHWVKDHYGFVPHPFWIAHCRELYLGAPASVEGRQLWHECPPDKRQAIRAAFLHFGMLPP